MKPLEIVDRYVQKHSPRHLVAMFSGGHDSLVATHVASQHPAFSFALHINTGIGVEQTRDFVRDTCSEWGIELREYFAVQNQMADGTPEPQVYEDIVRSAGFPGPAQHGRMYRRLKERALRHAIRDLDRERNDKTLLVSGVREQESKRRMRTKDEEWVWEGTKVWVSPLYKFSKVEINGYIEEHGLRRNEVVDMIHKSGECLCGAFAKPGELKELEAWFPEVAEKIRSLEREVSEAGFPWGWEERPPRWYMEAQRGQLFLPGMEEIMCSSCAVGEGGNYET